MNIGNAASKSGLSAKMIRHYERTGLLKQVQRTDAGYRKFSQRDIEILRFIRQARLLGFSIQQIDDLLTLWQDPRRSSRNVKAVAEQHLAEVNEKLQELQQMKNTLKTMIAACHNNDTPECAILDQLSPP